jgi:hypothetical protein
LLIDDPQLINRIRHSATLVATLPPETQRAARDSYAIALRAVFTMAAVSTAVGFVVRLPVSFAFHSRCHFDAHARCFAQVPEKTLDYQLVREPVVEDALESEPALTIHDDDVSGGGEAAVVSHQHGRRRLSLSR